MSVAEIVGIVLGGLSVLLLLLALVLLQRVYIVVRRGSSHSPEDEG